MLLAAGQSWARDIGWHSFRHAYRSLLDGAAAPVGVQEKLMVIPRVVEMVLPSKERLSVAVLGECDAKIDVHPHEFTQRTLMLFLPLPLACGIKPVTSSMPSPAPLN